MAEDHSSLHKLRAENQRLRDEMATLRLQMDRLTSGHTLTSLAELIPAAIAMYQNDSIVFANRAAFECVGLEPTAANRGRLLDCLAPGDRDGVRQRAEARHRNPPASPEDREIAVYTIAGERRWVLSRTTVIQYNDAPATLSVSVDITDNKLMEERLTASQANLRAILESTSDFILLSDRNARPVYFNSAYAAIMKDIMGIDMKPGLQPHTLLPDAAARAEWDDYHRRVLSGEQFRAESSIPDADGRVRYFEHTFYPIRDSDGVVGFCEFTHETTERRHQQDRYQQLQREQTGQLQRVAGGLAHEIFNAVFPAGAALLKLKERLKQSSEPERDSYLKTLSLAKRSLERTIELTESVRLFSRLEHLETDKPVDLKKLVAEVVQQRRDQLDSEAVALQCRIDDDLYILCPRAHLYSLIENLLANGIAAVRESSRREIIIAAKGTSTTTHIRFSDTGKGIDPQHRDQIFQPFFTTRPGVGSGLGLAIVKRVVDLCGGSIEIETALGEGTTFDITLPCLQASP